MAVNSALSFTGTVWGSEIGVRLFHLGMAPEGLAEGRQHGWRALKGRTAWLGSVLLCP